MLDFLFGRHRVRGNFYHAISIIFLISMILWFFGIIPDNVSTVIGMCLFVVDYLAEMYDPHPENPGPWFKSHFHRFFDSDEEEEKECKYEDLYKKLYFDDSMS